MPDNPRNQDQHTDIPSSRHSAGMPNPAGSTGSGNYNTSQPQQGGSHHPKIHPRNILIGSIVTIITSTIIFYLTQYLKKPDNDKFLETKQATSSAWSSYVGYENIYMGNILSFTKNPANKPLDSILAGFKKESDKFLRDISDLASEKRIDKDLKKMLTRRIENEKASLPVLEEYYSKMNKINSSSGTLKEKITATADELTRYNEYVKGASERAINDIRGIAEVLAKRYDLKLSMNDFLIIQLQPQLEKTNDSIATVLRSIEFDSSGAILDKTAPVTDVKEKDIIGNWNADGSVFTFEKNGKMAWVIGGGQKAIGTWKIETGKLRLDGMITPQNQKGYWLFTVSEISENSFVLTSVKDESIYYELVKIITQ